MYGDLISNIIDFLIIAFIVFLAYKQLSKFKLVEDKRKTEPKIRRLMACFIMIDFSSPGDTLHSIQGLTLYPMSHSTVSLL